MASKSAQSTGTQSMTKGSELSGRVVPMKVLCLGYSRTGTRSLRDALLMLGFHHTYHTFDAAWLNPRDCKAWLEALRAKYDGVGTVPGREEFDQLLGHCQAVTDFPAAYFAEELIAAYPEAKVILTVRDVDEWHRSVKNTLEVADNSLINALLGLSARVLLMPNRWNYPMFQKLHQALYWGDFERNGRKRFEEHYDLVRSLVPKERLLEYHISQGWEPLCKFLGKPVPAEDVPFINEAAGVNERLRSMYVVNAKAQLRRVLDVSAYTALAVLVVSALMGRRLSFL